MGMVNGMGGMGPTGNGKRRGLAVFAAYGAFAILLAACERTPVEKGRISLSLGDYPMAVRFFQSAVEKNPQLYDARLGLGQALLQKAYAEDDSASFQYALVQLEACRSLAPSQDLSELLTDAYYERARKQLKTGDTVAALASLSKSIDHGPKNPRPLNLVGIVYGKLGEAEKAGVLFQKALRMDSTDASSHFNLGMLSWQAGDVRSAHGHWFKALKTLPEDEDVLYWFALSEKKLRETP
ncbi:MAG: Tetratricopeptide 2 repeat protein [Fibrobacteres bacterium]|nr:Tetratricopeptide 2 repeat protein [Fibrobacterota bacterium]